MSARADLLFVLEGGSEDHCYCGGEFCESAEKLIDNFAHELAEQIRASQLVAPEGFVLRQSWIDAWNEGRDDSAGLIDPEVEK